MNRIQNDRREWVIAIGSPNSMARMKQKWPELIASCRVQYAEIPLVAVIVSDLVQQGFERWEATSIAEAVEAMEGRIRQ